MKAKWFDRSFTFDLPASAFSDVVRRLRWTPVRVASTIAPLDAKTLTRRDGDRWSIQENVGHLLDLEPLWIGRVRDILGGETRLRAADLTNRRTHEADHNAARLFALYADFGRARAELLDALESVDASAIERSALHPRLEQPMRMIDLAFFVAEHDDHHLTEMTRLARHTGG